MTDPLAAPEAPPPPKDDRQGHIDSDCEVVRGVGWMCTCQTPKEKAEDAQYRAECEAERDAQAGASSSLQPRLRDGDLSVRDVARYLGCGELSASKAWDFIVEREQLLRVAQQELETHKSDAATAELAIRDRIRVLKALAAPDPLGEARLVYTCGHVLDSGEVALKMCPVCMTQQGSIHFAGELRAQSAPAGPSRLRTLLERMRNPESRWRIPGRSLEAVFAVIVDAWADALEEALVGPAPANRFDCLTCGQGIAVDEDGCCRTCGADATVVGPAPACEPRRQNEETKDDLSR